MSRLPVLSAAAALLLSACTAAPPPVDKAGEEQAIRAISSHWLELDHAKDATGIGALFTDDGVMYREDSEPVVGPAAIADFQAKDFSARPQVVADWTTDRVDVADSGELAVEYGSWSESGSPEGNDHGSYVTVYKKVNGEWKVAADMALSTTPDVAGDTDTPM